MTFDETVKKMNKEQDRFFADVKENVDVRKFETKLVDYKELEKTVGKIIKVLQEDNRDVQDTLHIIEFLRQELVAVTLRKSIAEYARD